MSIYYSGTFKKSAGILSSVLKQLKAVNLKPVKKIQVTFDPFHPNALTARHFLYYINNKKVLSTNINCIIKPNIVCDRSQPEIKIDLANSSTITFKAENLNIVEILQYINKHISSKVPVEDENTSLQTNKLEKKKLKRK